MSSPRELSQKPKELVDANSIAEGEIELRHLASGLFGEIRSIKFHGHEGISSKNLTSSAFLPTDLIYKAVFDYQVDDNNTITATTNGSGLHIQFGWGQVAG